jgi:hypothetical protein
MAHETRRTLQVVLLSVALLAVGLAGWRYVEARRPGAALGPSKRVVATPSSGPIGVRPILDLEGWPPDARLTVFLCTPASTSHTDACVELVADASGHVPSPQVAPIPPSIGPEPVTPQTYLLRGGTGTPEDPFDVHGRFEVVPFHIADPPSARSYPPGSQIAAGPPTEIARGASCDVEVTPDDRILVGRRLVDLGNGVITEVALEGAEVVWSPARDRLAIVTGDRKEIRLAAPDGSGAEVVRREARGILASVTWSPEGDHIAFTARSDPAVRGGPGPPTVHFFNLTTGESGTLGAGERVAWSPVGDRLAVEVRGEVQIGDLQANRTPLLSGIKPAWSPDGSLVAAVRAGPDGAGEAWVARADAPHSARLVPDAVCGLAFSAGGTRLVTAQPAAQGASLQVRELQVRGSS